MKKAILFTLFILTLGCKKSSENLTNLKGSFIFFDDAAVLQTSDAIYGVYLNDKAIELNKISIQYKNIASDAVSVELKGNISTETHDKILWEKKFEIIEIISIESKKEIK